MTATTDAITIDRLRQVLARGGLVEITTTGRRTGLPRRIPIVFHNIGGRVYISGMPRRQRRNWLANLAADPRFVFHLVRGLRADLPGRARVITDEEERRAVLAHVARTWGRDDIEVMVRFSPLIEVVFEEPVPPA